MITFKQYISELFEKPYPFGKIQKEHGRKYMATALTDAGKLLKIEFDQLSNGTWDISFKVSGSYTYTGQGDAFKIFATVIAATKEFIQQFEPDELIIVAMKELGLDNKDVTSREKLYSRMTKKFARELGYTLYTSKTRDAATYRLLRK